MTKASVELVRPHLVKLRGGLVRLVTPEPQRLAYQLRQGIAAAGHIGDEDIPSIAYTVLVVSGAVVCVPTGESPSLARRLLPRSILQMIQSILEDNIRVPTEFTNVSATGEEIASIVDWAAKKGMRLTQINGKVVVTPLEKIEDEATAT